MGNFSWPFLVTWDTKAPRGHIVPSDLFEARLPNEATRCFHLRKRSFEQTWANQSNCVTLIKKNIQRYSKPCTWKVPCNLKQVVCIVDVNITRKISLWKDSCSGFSFHDNIAKRPTFYNHRNQIRSQLNNPRFHRVWRCRRADLYTHT